MRKAVRTPPGRAFAEAAGERGKVAEEGEGVVAEGPASAAPLHGEKEIYGIK